MSFVTRINPAFSNIPQQSAAIGRPRAFSDCPPFQLNGGKKYGFEYEFTDETPQRQNELNISFNRSVGQRHTLVYMGPLENFIQQRGYGGPNNPIRPFENFTAQDCIDFADSLPNEQIIAFDFEPNDAWRWSISNDMNNGSFVTNIQRVSNRLKTRGILAYDYLLQKPGFKLSDETYQRFNPDGSSNTFLMNFTLHNMYEAGGINRRGSLDVLQKYLKFYTEPQKRIVSAIGGSLVNLGPGYANFQYAINESTAQHTQNDGQFGLYLRYLDALEMSRILYPDQDILLFTWLFIEDYSHPFPSNGKAFLSQYNGSVKRLENKCLYPAHVYADMLVVGLLYAKFLFYWSPGQSRNDPKYALRYTSQYKSNGDTAVWEWLGPGNIPPNPGEGTYIGKETFAVNAVIDAAQRYSQIQDRTNNADLTAVTLRYRRRTRNYTNKTITLQPVATVFAYTDRSHFLRSAINKQPFAFVAKNRSTGAKTLFVQDIFCHPTLSTDFEFDFEGQTVSQFKGFSNESERQLTTLGNRLFIGTF